MPDRCMEDLIRENLAGDARRNALAFASFLKASEMYMERGKGYWEDKLYWMICCQGESVCYILIDGSGDKGEAKGWTIWSDDSDSNCFADFPLEEPMQEIAWKNVVICGRCGGCESPGGSRKTIFGKDFDNVCITSLKFINPDAQALACAMKLVQIRKDDILK